MRARTKGATEWGAVMAIDIFRGFNRLKLVVQGLTVAAGIAAIVFSDPRSDLKLETAGPDDSWHIATKKCDVATDAIDSIYDVPADLSERIWAISLCFRAMEFPEQEVSSQSTKAAPVESGPWDDYANQGTTRSTEAATAPQETDPYAGLGVVEEGADPYAGFSVVEEGAEQQTNQMLIPYKVDKGGMYWGNEKDSPEVTSYTGDRVRNFSINLQLKPAVLEWAEQDNKKKWYEDFRWTLIVVASIVAGLEVFSRILGWIIRGFVKDKSRPSSGNSSTEPSEESASKPL